MARPGASLGLFAYGFCMSLATVFMGVSLGTTNWLKTQNRWGDTYHYGLFRVRHCDDLGRCDNYESDVPLDYIKTVQALCVCAMVIFGLSLVRVAYMVLLQTRDVWSTRRLQVVAIFSFIASVLAIAGSVQYVTRVDDVEFWGGVWRQFGYSLYLAVASAPLSLLSGLFALFAARRLRSSHCAQRPSPILGQPAPLMYTDTDGGPPPPTHHHPSVSPESSAPPPDYYSTLSHSQTTDTGRVYPPPAHQHHHQVQQHEGYNYNPQRSYQGYDGNATTVPHLPPPQVEKQPPPYSP